MAIIKNDYLKTDGLQLEIDAISTLLGDAVRQFESLSYEEFVEKFIIRHDGIEFKDCLKYLKEKSEILDVGAGYGQSSLFLAMQGHTVSVVEPSPEYCQCIETMSKKFGVTITSYESSIEALKTDQKFDACIFNASLHHCDDPYLAVKKCVGMLKDDGKIFLINEQVIRFYKSKKQYYRSLIENPGKTGHYGGNEHVYRYFEYLSMLRKASIRKIIEKVPAYYLNPKILLKQAIEFRSFDGYEHSAFNIVLRAIWYYILSKVLGIKVILFIASRLSLINCTIIGIKN